MVFYCPYTPCPRYFHSKKALQDHIDDDHMGMGRPKPGWFEEQRPQLTDRGVELKALEHQIAALKSMEREAPLSIPIVAPPPEKARPNLPVGWMEVPDGYSYIREISSRRSRYEASRKVLEAKVTANHGIATLFTYEKDLTEVAGLQDKALKLEARIERHVFADPAYHEIAEELYKINNKMRDLTEKLRPDEYVEDVLEDYYYGRQGSEEHMAWQTGFMQKVVGEAERLIGLEEKSPPI